MDGRFDALFAEFKQALRDDGWEHVDIMPWHLNLENSSMWGPRVGYEFRASRYCDQRCGTFAAAIRLRDELLLDTPHEIATQVVTEGFRNNWETRFSA